MYLVKYTIQYLSIDDAFNSWYTIPVRYIHTLEEPISMMQYFEGKD
jgi:hypothetical protein